MIRICICLLVSTLIISCVPSISAYTGIINSLSDPIDNPNPDPGIDYGDDSTSCETEPWVEPDDDSPNFGDDTRYYLVGYIDSEEYHGNDYQFVNGQVSLTLNNDYICVKDSNNNYYMARGWLGFDVTEATLYKFDEKWDDNYGPDSINRLYVPAGKFTFTISNITEKSLKISYSVYSEEVTEPVTTKPTETTKPSTSLNPTESSSILESSSDQTPSASDPTESTPTQGDNEPTSAATDPTESNAPTTEPAPSDPTESTPAQGDNEPTPAVTDPTESNAATTESAPPDPTESTLAQGDNEPTPAATDPTESTAPTTETAPSDPTESTPAQDDNEPTPAVTDQTESTAPTTETTTSDPTESSSNQGSSSAPTITDPTGNGGSKPSQNTSTTTKKTQKITKVKSKYTKTYGAKKFSLNAKASGNGKLSYKSSNKKVVKVSKKGKVTVVGLGKATITITAAKTSKYKKATKKITVTVKPDKINFNLIKKSVKKENNGYTAYITMPLQKNADEYKYVVSYNSGFNGISENRKKTNPNILKLFELNTPKDTYYIKATAGKKINGKMVYGKELVFRFTAISKNGKVVPYINKIK